MKNFSTKMQQADQLLVDFFVKESPCARDLRLQTEHEVDYAHMMSTPAQAAYLAFMIRLLKVKRILEIGVFTGYSTLIMAETLPAEGEIVACDHSAQWTEIAKAHWVKAGVSDKITLHCADALETLEFLSSERGSEKFDLIFIDADKIHYPEYYQFALQLVQSGGLIVLDNVIQVNRNRVVEAELPATRVLKSLLQKISEDQQVTASLLPLAEGMLLVKKN